ncbi:MAG: DNA-binding protein [Eubacteriales bacterium]|nr:DNA-binding protein [Eubacteriales bacterium]
MENSIFVTADTVAADLGVSKPFAYKLMKKMNNELEEKGYMTISGRVSRQYYIERFYGLNKVKEGVENGNI